MRDVDPHAPDEPWKTIPGLLGLPVEPFGDLAGEVGIGASTRSTGRR